MSKASKVLRKPSSFMEIYKHKPGPEKDRTHYCPGCGHGIIHKLIAEALEDMEITERTVMISPVGCSVFLYYYFNTGNLQVAHGRAPAVATAASRANPDSVVISYQGDGDLAAIGGNNILQAANRGENIAVVFVNNAIYGMTGGQMAPTTLPGQKTTTSPYGRNPANEGYPLKMVEILNCLDAPTYLARTSLHDVPNMRKTRQAIRKAIQNVKDKKGFSLVEVLSMCPSQWRTDGPAAQKWILEKMIPTFPLGVVRDLSDEREPIARPVPVMEPTEVKRLLGLISDEEVAGASASRDFKRREVAPQHANPSIRVAGFGGQGVLSIGVALANVGMEYGYNVSWLPSYGPEMRGGTANCSVKIQEATVGAVEATEPTVVIAMNRPSMERFEKILVPGGLLIYNSTLIEIEPTRGDISVVAAPITKLADDLGNTKVQSMVAVGAYIGATGLFDLEDVVSMLPRLFPGKKELLDLNERAVRAGYDHVVAAARSRG
ncbi:2-oxoacid:acceptor oxidoreductase family protein [Candidatus Fermentibacterales bacterium]|nr:2-oxoacid:acceptor oxidoreductase family protein [Candidatus Fermentibacterales bacterium]